MDMNPLKKANDSTSKINKQRVKRYNIINDTTRKNLLYLVEYLIKLVLP